jgi:hypothetical protein
MKKKIALILLSVVQLVYISCESNPVEQKATPGRRDYVWTVDTINPGQESLYLGRIWGSSPDDVWAVGSSSWTATSIWHYDGLQWKCDSIPRKINPFAVFGLSSNEVWLGNSNKTIWKFDGTQWQQFGEYKVKDYDAVTVQDFDGVSSNNIYGVGLKYSHNSDTSKGIIMHYDGYNWAMNYNLVDTRVNFETVAADIQSGILVISGTVYDPRGFVAKVYCWDGSELKELLSGSGLSFVTKLGGEIFATLDSKIYKYSNKQLTLWKDNTGTGINGNIICGRNSNDFFIGGSSGIVHYNGSDFTNIYINELGHNIEIMRGAIFEKNVFVIAVDFTLGKNLIIHGKLQ